MKKAKLIAGLDLRAPEVIWRERDPEGYERAHPWMDWPWPLAPVAAFAPGEVYRVDRGDGWTTVRVAPISLNEGDTFMVEVPVW